MSVFMLGFVTGLAVAAVYVAWCAQQRAVIRQCGRGRA